MSNLTFKSRFLVLFVGLLTMCVTQVWGESTVTTYTFNSKSWGATCNGSAANWTGSADGNQYSASQTPIGVQILAAGNGTTVTSPKSFTNVSKVVVNYSSSSKGVGSIKVSVGGTDIDTKSISKSQSKVDLTYTPSTNLSGNVVITCNCTTNSYALVSVSVTEESGASNTPTITKSGTLTAFTATYGSASTEQTFTVGGSKLTANITVSAPTNYEISKTTGAGFGSSVTLTKDGSCNVANTTLYIRLKNNVAAGSVAAASISCTSTGATEQTISIPASKVQSKVNWSVNGSAAAGSPTLAVDKAGKVTTLPTAPTSSDCDGSKVFVGWTDATIASPTNTKPSTLFTAASGAPAVNANEVTYYAVFATAGGGAETLLETVGFESSEGYTATTTYNSSSYTTGSIGSKWKINYGAFSTTSAIIGSQSAQFRIYNSGGGYGQLMNTVAYSSDISKVVFSAKTANTNGQVKVSYSTNGSSWTDITTQSLTTTTTEYTVEVPVSGVKYIKFTAAGARPSSNNYSIYVDCVKLYNSGTTYSNYATTCGPAGSCATPTFSQEEGSYCGTQSVTISCSTGGASIYYTTDGTTTPTSSSTLYSSAISVSADMTIKAIAVKAGLIDSEVATATYSITNLRDTFIDNLHENAKQYGDCDNYTVPSLSDATPASACEGEHYHFVGWSSAQLYTGQHATEPAGLLKAGSHHSADGTTYYAVWAKEQH